MRPVPRICKGLGTQGCALDSQKLGLAREVAGSLQGERLLGFPRKSGCATRAMPSYEFSSVGSLCIGDDLV